MKKMIVSVLLLIVPCITYAMEDRDAEVTESVNSMRVLAHKFAGQSPLSEDIIAVYKTCLARKTHSESTKDHLMFEFSSIELLRSLYDFSAHELETHCEENTQTVLAHKGADPCASCKSEAIRAAKLEGLAVAIQGQQDAIKRKMAIKCALFLLELEPLENSLHKAHVDKCAIENDLKTCSKLQCKKP